MTNVHAMIHKPTDAAVPMVELCIHGGGRAKFRRGLTVADDALPAVQRLKLVLAECANDLEEDSSDDRLARAFLTFLSRRQTIDKVGQLLGRGLVSKDNREMKCTTSKLLTCRVTNGGLIWSAFYVVRSQKINLYKSVGVLIVCHFLTLLS